MKWIPKPGEVVIYKPSPDVVPHLAMWSQKAVGKSVVVTRVERVGSDQIVYFVIDGTTRGCPVKRVIPAGISCVL